MGALARLACALLLLLLCSACSGSQSALDPHGNPALALYGLIKLIVIVCTAVWLLVMAVLGCTLWWPGAERPQPLAIDSRAQHRMTIAVLTATIVTAVIITAFSVASFATRRSVDDESNALVIRLKGYQWWWEVSYADHSADRSFVTANEIHVPVGRAVRVELAAADVIHSFWIPSLAGKQDQIPGRDNSLTFVAQRAGRYRGQCAEFCGLQHAHMGLLVIADEGQDFDAWRAGELASAASPADEEQQAGQHVFISKACAACHTVRGTAAAGTLGPDLTHVGSRRTIAAGVLENTRGSLAAWIADPQTIKPGNNMPLVSLAADELKAVSAYMAGLK
jgi:cytochrome c oxidase subunit 2